MFKNFVNISFGMAEVDLVTLLLHNLGGFRTEYVHYVDPNSNHDVQADMIFERLRRLVPNQERYTSSSGGSRIGREDWWRELRLDYSFNLPLLSVEYDEAHKGEIVIKTPLFVEGLIKREIQIAYAIGVS